MEFIAKNTSELRAIATQIKPLIDQYRIVAFYGGMGAGKTTFIKAICDVYHSDSIVSSPTFALVNEYGLPDGDLIYHFDFYRINDISEAFDIGYEEYFFSDQLCFIEWPDKAEEILPHSILMVKIEVLSDTVRRILVERPQAIA